MFKVKSIETNNIYTVCGCQEIRGVIYFLIHNGTHWVWTEAERFEPYDEPQSTSTPYVPYIPYPFPCPSQPLDIGDNDWWIKPYITWSAEPKDNSL